MTDFLAAAYHVYGRRLATGDGIERDMERAAQWYAAAALRGHAASEFALAGMYMLGDGVPRDLDRASRLYRSAVVHGHPVASVFEQLVNGV